MEGSVGRVVSRIVKGVLERLLDSKKNKLPNSGVSKQRSYNLFVTLPHVMLENTQFISNNSGAFGQATL
jgi:hypothetical protein